MCPVASAAARCSSWRNLRSAQAIFLAAEVQYGCTQWSHQRVPTALSLSSRRQRSQTIYSGILQAPRRPSWVLGHKAFMHTGECGKLGDASHRQIVSVTSAQAQYAPVCLVGATNRLAELEPDGWLSLSQVIKKVKSSRYVTRLLK